MEKYEITDMRDIPAILVKNGQKVVIVRNVSFSYEADIEAILDEMGETEISLESLIRGELDNNTVSVNLEYCDKTGDKDDSVLTVEIG